MPIKDSLIAATALMHNLIVATGPVLRRGIRLPTFFLRLTLGWRCPTMSI
jgi:hypothetical protein